MKYKLLASCLFIASCGFIYQQNSEAPEILQETALEATDLPKEAKPLKVLSWNIANLADSPGQSIRGGHVRSEKDYARLREIIEAQNPDIIALQEVSSFAAAEQILNKSVYEIQFESRCLNNRENCLESDGDIYTAIAYKNSLEDAQDFQIDELAISHTNECGVTRRVRGAVGVKFRYGKTVIHVPSLHMKASCKDDTVESGTEDDCVTQRAQYEALVNWMNQIPEDDAIVLAGDFNRKLLSNSDSIRLKLTNSNDLSFLPESGQRSCFSDQDFRYDYALLTSQAFENNPSLREQNVNPYIYTPKSNQAIDFFIVRGLGNVSQISSDQIELPADYRMENPGDTILACDGETVVKFENQDRALVFADAYPSDHCPIVLDIHQ